MTSEDTGEDQSAAPVKDELGFPIEGEIVVDELPEEPVKERELTAMEMMGAPNRPSDHARQTVLWISFGFCLILFAMTIAVITFSGLDILTLLTGILFGFMSWVLFGAVRYKGEDPMAKFDPPPRPKTKFFGRGKKK